MCTLHKIKGKLNAKLHVQEGEIRQAADVVSKTHRVFSHFSPDANDLID